MKKNPHATSSLFPERKRSVSIKAESGSQIIPSLSIKEIKNILSKYVVSEIKPSRIGKGQEAIDIIYIEAANRDEGIIMMVEVFNNENYENVLNVLLRGSSVAQVVIR